MSYERFTLYDALEGKAMREPAQVTYNNSLPYKEFLKSPYWQHVRRTIFNGQRPWCRGCGAKNGTVDVHHKTYKHKGDELNHLEDLTVLCRDCHRETHGLPSNKPAQRETSLMPLCPVGKCDGSGWVSSISVYAGMKLCPCRSMEIRAMRGL